MAEVKTKGLKIGSRIAHRGSDCETYDNVYVVTIIGYDRMAIEVKTDTGETYFINTWDLCEMPKTELA